MISKLKIIGHRFKKELDYYRAIKNDRRTPLISKILLGIAIGYVLLPFDIIPDFIPVLGQIDDFILVPLLVTVSLKMIPRVVIDDAKI